MAEDPVNFVQNVKALFEGELKEARKLLDELSKENAQIKLESQTIKDENKTHKNRIRDIQKEKEKLEDENNKTGKELEKKTLEFASLAKVNNHLREELAAIKRELALALEEIESLKDNEKKETIRRIDAENKFETVKEEFQFTEKLHQEEIAAARKRNTLQNSVANQGSKGGYESKLEAVMMDLREQQHADLETMKEELEDYYESKITDLSKQLNEACAASAKAQESGKLFEVKVDRLQDTIKTLQSESNNLENQVINLEGEVEVEKQLRITAVQVVERERDEAREAIARMQKEYSELLDTNFQLDHEISVYRKLLEEEEQRLKLSPNIGGESGKARRTRTRRKRKRNVPAQSEEETRTPKKMTLTSLSDTIESAQRIVGAEQENAEANKSCMIM